LFAKLKEEIVEWLTWTRVFSGSRMERLKQMREDMHRKYTELTDEKEIIRTCA